LRGSGCVRGGRCRGRAMSACVNEPHRRGRDRH
jgi:hypothetical protein